MTRKSWSVDYGRETRSFEIDSEFDVLSLTAAEIDLDVDESEAVREAIKNPIGSPVLNQLVRPGEKVCIITSDITRPCPSSVVLPPLIDELTQAGIHLDDITIVFALGSHRRHTQDEQRQLVGHDLYAKVHTVDSDPEDTVFLGTTKLGTPVNIHPVVAQADRRICVGNIELSLLCGLQRGRESLDAGRFPTARQSRRITVGWLNRTPVQVRLTTICFDLTWKRRLICAAVILSSMLFWMSKRKLSRRWQATIVRLIGQVVPSWTVCTRFRSGSGLTL